MAAIASWNSSLQSLFRRRYAKLAVPALVAGLLIAVSGPAQAQFFGFHGWSISENDVYRTIARNGFRPLAEPVRNGNVFLADVVDARNRRQRLIIDAYHGDILQAYSIAPARPPFGERSIFGQTNAPPRVARVDPGWGEDRVMPVPGSPADEATEPRAKRKAHNKPRSAARDAGIVREQGRQVAPDTGTSPESPRKQAPPSEATKPSGSPPEQPHTTVAAPVSPAPAPAPAAAEKVKHPPSKTINDVPVAPME